MKYSVSWTTEDGQRIENQVYTADAISGLLKNLESWNADNIVVKSIKEE